MNQRIKYIILAVCSWFLQAQAQQLNPTVMPSQGGTARNGNTVLTYTVGQLPTQVGQVNDWVLTPGFEQPGDKIGQITTTTNPSCGGGDGTVNVAIKGSLLNNGAAVTVTIKQGSTTVYTGTWYVNTSGEIVPPAGLMPMNLAAGTYTIYINYGGETETETFTVPGSSSWCCGGNWNINSWCNPANQYLNLTFGDITASELASKLCLIYHNGTYNVNFGSVAIAFNGVLTIDVNFSFNDCSNMVFGPGAQILIESGNTLTLSNDHLYACGDTLWKGINVAELTTAQTVTNLISENLTKIENAQYAVWAGPKAKVSIQDTKFNDNFIGCYFSGGTIFSPGSPSLTNTFERNSFTADADLLNNYQGMNNSGAQPSLALMSENWPWAGIEFESVTNNTNIGAVGSLFDDNGFTKLNNGIVAYNSNVTVNNCAFSEIQNIGYNGFEWPPIGPAVPAAGNGILSVAAPIRHPGSPPSCVLEVGSDINRPGHNNGFTNCFNGVVTYQLNKVAILGNFFTENGIYAGHGNTGVTISSSKLAPSLAVNRNNMTLSGIGIDMLQNDPCFETFVLADTIDISGNGSNGTGIYVSENNIAPRITSSYENNVITLESSANGDGIDFNTAANIRCQENMITLTHYATTGSNGNGIFFGSCTANLAQDNTVIGTDVADVPTAYAYHVQPPYVGIGEFNSTGTAGISNSVYNCNTTRNLYLDLFFDGIGSKNSVIEGNNLNFDAGDVSTVGINYDATATNINEQKYAGNLWFGTFNGNPALDNYSFCLGNPPGYLIPLGTNPTDNWVPTGEIWSPICFVSQESNANPCGQYNCAGTGCPGLEETVPNPGITAFDREVIDDSILYSSYNTELCWVAGKFMYEYIMVDTALMDTGSDVRAFYAAKAAGATGSIEAVENQQLSGLQPDSLIANALGAIQDSMSCILQKITETDSVRATLVDSAHFVADSIESAYLENLIDQELKDSTYYSDTALQNTIDSFTLTIVNWDTATLESLNAQIDSLDSVFGAYNSAADSLGNVIDSIRRQVAAVAVDSAYAISPVLDIEHYYREAYLIYLSTIAQDSIFDSAQTTTLYHLAFMCPFKGGNAVMMARGMLALLVDTTYNDSLLCAIDTGSGCEMMMRLSSTDTTQTDSSKPNIQIALYPNPAKDYAFLQLSQSISPLSLQIIDAEGNLVINQSITTVAGSYTINTAGFSSGLYCVNLYTGNGRIFDGKLSIFR